MALMRIGEFSQKTGRSQQKLRQMDQNGTLKPAVVGNGGTRYYSEEQLEQILHPEGKSNGKKVIGYCRVSTNGEKDDLQTQIQNVKTYMIAKGYSFDVISDIGSGINYKKKGLKELFKMVNDREVSKIVVLDKDRLMRFGYEMFAYFCELNNVEIEEELPQETDCNTRMRL